MGRNRVMNFLRLWRRWLTVMIVMVLFTGFSLSEVFAKGKRVSCFEFVGTYLTTNFNDDGGVDSRSLLTLWSDGNFSFVDSNQGGVPGSFNSFTEAMGSWTCTRTGKKEHIVSIVALDFTLPGTEGSVQEIARLDFFKVTVDRKTGHIQGYGKLQFFPLDSSPIDPPRTLEDPFRFEGERFSLKPLKHTKPWFRSDSWSDDERSDD